MHSFEDEQRLLFPDDVLIAYGNQLLEAADTSIRIKGILTRGVHHVEMYASSPGGKDFKMVAPVCSFAAGLIGFRSLLRVVSPYKETTWLTNGQASRNTREIVFHGEQGPKLAASREAYEKYARSRLTEETPEKAVNYVNGEIERIIGQGYLGDTFEVVTDDGRTALLETSEAPGLKA